MTPFTSLESIRSFFRKLVFRRVHVVSKDAYDLQSIVRYFDDNNAIHISREEYENLPEEIRERECELHYKTFAGLVNSQPLLLRGKTCTGCCEVSAFPISFNSESYCEIDLSLTCSNPDIPILKSGANIPPRESRSVKMGRMYKKEFLRLENHENEWVESDNISKKWIDDGNVYVKTIEGKIHKVLDSKKEWVEKIVNEEIPGDLICGAVDPNNRNKFLFWFVASEQFFRFYKIIMHNNNHVCTVKAKLNTREAVLSGNNKLCTNTFKKLNEVCEIEKKIAEKEQQNAFLINERKKHNSAEMEKFLESLEKLRVVEENIQELPNLDWARIIEDEFIRKDIDEKIAINRCIAEALRKEREKQTIVKYWRRRQEHIAHDYVHFYIGMIMIFIYGESLTSKNLPKNAKKWDVPDVLLSF